MFIKIMIILILVVVEQRLHRAKLRRVDAFVTAAEVLWLQRLRARGATTGPLTSHWRGHRAMGDVMLVGRVRM